MLHCRIPCRLNAERKQLLLSSVHATRRPSVVILMTTAAIFMNYSQPSPGSTTQPKPPLFKLTAVTPRRQLLATSDDLSAVDTANIATRYPPRQARPMALQENMLILPTHCQLNGVCCLPCYRRNFPTVFQAYEGTQLSSTNAQVSILFNSRPG